MFLWDTFRWGLFGCFFKVSLAAANSTKGQVKSRKEVIAEKAPPLNISEDTTTEELIEVVRMLREKLETVHGEIFDMTKKTQKQDYHVSKRFIHETVCLALLWTSLKEDR